MKKKIILSVALVLLVVMIATICVACTPSVDSVAKKFEKNEYSVTKTENSVVAVKKGEGGGLNTILGAKEISIVWYEDEETAQKAYDAKVTLLGEKCVKKKGTAVASGDEDSVKLF
ncbi:MAG: hypothetical protein K2H36_01865 [Clostridia bacterium]|nr:hypothetical protein [Clostridia bacterium]MDE6757804.1 hypothetical protein [Clostridia bacterium]